MKTLCTIGHTKKSLRGFVELLRTAHVTKVIDVRLRNTSQLAGFSKKDDLAFALELSGIEYEHAVDLAPTDRLLDGYRATKDWQGYLRGYQSLLRKRDPLTRLKRAARGHDVVCLLCTEEKPDRCHRRLIAEYAAERMRAVTVAHL